MSRRTVFTLMRWLRDEARWFMHEFLPAPRFALYARRQNQLNRAFFLRVKAEAPDRNSFLEAYRPRPIPKVVWIYWAQGAAEAPSVVRHCIDSWTRLNPGWDVRVLDAESAADYANLSDVPRFLPLRYGADLLRKRLLKNHGGVWADATLLCHRSLDDWLPLIAASGFFVFTNPGPDREVANWFIASEPGGVLISSWEDAYTAFLKRLHRMPRAYFMSMYSFQWRILTDPQTRDAWRRQAALPAPSAFLLMGAIEGGLPLDAAHDAIAGGLPVSKLSWKSKVPWTETNRVLNVIAAGKESGLKR